MFSYTATSLDPPEFGAPLVEVTDQGYDPWNGGAGGGRDWDSINGEVLTHMPLRDIVWRSPAGRLLDVNSITPYFRPLSDVAPPTSTVGLPMDWYRRPLLHIFLVTVTSTKTYSDVVRLRLKAWHKAMLSKKNEWMILYAPCPTPADESEDKFRKILSSIRSDVSAGKKERVVRIDIFKELNMNVIVDDSPAQASADITDSVRQSQSGGFGVLDGIGRSTSSSVGSGIMNNLGGVLGVFGSVSGSPEVHSSSNSLDGASPYEEQWIEFCRMLSDLLMISFGAICTEYDSELKKLSTNQAHPCWNFFNFFLVKQAYAFILCQFHQWDDALRLYTELDALGLDKLKPPAILGDSELSIQAGGIVDTVASDINSVTLDPKSNVLLKLEDGDDRALLFSPMSKPYRQLIIDDCISEFHFRLYLYSCQLDVRIRKCASSEIFLLLNQAMSVVSDMSRRLFSVPIFRMVWIHNAMMQIALRMDSDNALRSVSFDEAENLASSGDIAAAIKILDSLDKETGSSMSRSVSTNNVLGGLNVLSSIDKPLTGNGNRDIRAWNGFLCRIYVTARDSLIKLKSLIVETKDVGNASNLIRPIIVNGITLSDSRFLELSSSRSLYDSEIDRLTRLACLYATSGGKLRLRHLLRCDLGKSFVRQEQWAAGILCLNEVLAVFEKEGWMDLVAEILPLLLQCCIGLRHSIGAARFCLKIGSLILSDRILSISGRHKLSNVFQKHFPMLVLITGIRIETISSISHPLEWLALGPVEDPIETTSLQTLHITTVHIEGGREVALGLDETINRRFIRAFDVGDVIVLVLTISSRLPVTVIADQVTLRLTSQLVHRTFSVSPTGTPLPTPRSDSAESSPRNPPSRSPLASSATPTDNHFSNRSTGTVPVKVIYCKLRNVTISGFDNNGSANDKNSSTPVLSQLKFAFRANQKGSFRAHSVTLDLGLLKVFHTLTIPSRSVMSIRPKPSSLQDCCFVVGDNRPSVIVRIKTRPCLLGPWYQQWVTVEVSGIGRQAGLWQGRSGAPPLSDVLNAYESGRERSSSAGGNGNVVGFQTRSSLDKNIVGNPMSEVEVLGPVPGDDINFVLCTSPELLIRRLDSDDGRVRVRVELLQWGASGNGLDRDKIGRAIDERWIDLNMDSSSNSYRGSLPFCPLIDEVVFIYVPVVDTSLSSPAALLSDCVDQECSDVDTTQDTLINRASPLSNCADVGLHRLSCSFTYVEGRVGGWHGDNITSRDTVSASFCQGVRHKIAAGICTNPSQFVLHVAFESVCILPIFIHSASIEQIDPVNSKQSKWQLVNFCDNENIEKSSQSPFLTTGQAYSFVFLSPEACLTDPQFVLLQVVYSNANKLNDIVGGSSIDDNDQGLLESEDSRCSYRLRLGLKNHGGHVHVHVSDDMIKGEIDRKNSLAKNDGVVDVSASIDSLNFFKISVECEHPEMIFVGQCIDLRLHFVINSAILDSNCQLCFDIGCKADSEKWMLLGLTRKLICLSDLDRDSNGVAKYTLVIGIIPLLPGLLPLPSIRVRHVPLPLTISNVRDLHHDTMDYGDIINVISCCFDGKGSKSCCGVSSWAGALGTLEETRRCSVAVRPNICQTVIASKLNTI